MNPFDLLTQRGFVQDSTDPDALRALFDSGPVTFYVGFDPTSPSLHIGHLAGMMAMAWLQRMGHRPIAVVGGGTGRIGDPSGRDDERQLLDDAAIAANLSGISRDLSTVLDLVEGGRLVDNHQWLGELRLVDFLREIGKHFSVNQMISRESVRRRLEEREHGISFTEFTYQLLQAYDFAHLHATEGCMLQGGGSDQWGNIVAGIDLTRRLHGAEVHGIVWPLVERSDGRKMSASEGAAVWLSPDLTSPYAFYQWFLNVPDADIDTFLRLYTFLEIDEIERAVTASKADPAARIGQRLLAEEATRIVHGTEGLEEAQRATAILFGDEPFSELSDATLRDAFSGAPSAQIARSRLGDIGLLEAMVAVGAAASNSEARRLVSQGGVRVNNVKIDDPGALIEEHHLLGSGTAVIRVGKKRYHLVAFV